jgi:hypothetical protein
MDEFLTSVKDNSLNDNRHKTMLQYLSFEIIKELEDFGIITPGMYNAMNIALTSYVEWPKAFLIYQFQRVSPTFKHYRAVLHNCYDNSSKHHLQNQVTIDYHVANQKVSIVNSYASNSIEINPDTLLDQTKVALYIQNPVYIERIRPCFQFYYLDNKIGRIQAVAVTSTRFSWRNLADPNGTLNTAQLEANFLFTVDINAHFEIKYSCHNETFYDMYFTADMQLQVHRPELTISHTTINERTKPLVFINNTFRLEKWNQTDIVNLDLESSIHETVNTHSSTFILGLSGSNFILALAFAYLFFSIYDIKKSLEIRKSMNMQS